MDPIEIIATIFGLLCVWFIVRESIWTFPTGIIMVSLYIIIFYQVRLYSDMGLQVFYVAFNIYGWYNWLHGGKDHGKLTVSYIGSKEAVLWTAIGGVTIAALGYGMSTYTNASFPYWDASTTIMSLIAQWLMTRKVIEHWLLWITVDVISICLYLLKSLYLTSGLYAVFLVLSIMGYVEWRKSYRTLATSSPEGSYA